MSSIMKYFRTIIVPSLLIHLTVSLNVTAQEVNKDVLSFEDYVEEFLEDNEIYLSAVEEWHNAIDNWLENPLYINGEDADLLSEFKVISLLQLNRLKEYRYKYGDLLSVQELAFIDDWDFQTVRKVMPLVTAGQSKNEARHRKFSYKPVRQSLVFKSVMTTEHGKGYDAPPAGEAGQESPYYKGSPIRLALRYDLEYRDRISAGLRMEKDAGEPMLIADSSSLKKIKLPDHVSGFVLVNRLGPVRSLILGDYRVGFGYGVNLSGGQTGINGRNGASGMSGRIRPQTSVSEAGYFRGIAFTAGTDRLTVSGFGSWQKLDGTSVTIDSLTGRPVSFSSIDRSGLHRSASEISGRKNITEQAAGIFLIYKNNWMKTGIISCYHRFNADIDKNDRVYAMFDLHGRDNLVSGISATIWLPKLQILSEGSLSQNGGLAMLAGIQADPVPGALISVTWRKFGVNYQNWNGSGFISSGRNSGESGLRSKLRLELPRKWLVEIITDLSASDWATYDLPVPGKRKEFKLYVEKAWTRMNCLSFSYRFTESDVSGAGEGSWLCRPEQSAKNRFRVESRIEAIPGVKLRSRIECSMAPEYKPGWLFLQDFECNLNGLINKLWLRTCFFEIMDYDCTISAYENDVLYDFTSFMHYGKGIRGICMARASPSSWMDVWLRISTVYYRNKNVGSGWDETKGNRQNEVEIQARFRWPGQ